jgi:uncharacterized membrane protein
MPNQLNLDGVVARGDVTLGREEHPDERAARLKQENRAAIIESCKDVAIFAALYVFLIVMVAICLYFILFAKTVTPETQRWSQSLLAAILSGTVSFLVGRKIGK